MIFSPVKKAESFVSTLLMCCFIFDLVSPLSSYARVSTAAASQGSTVAASLSSMVDGYTGDFRYSVPLATLPGPNGENVSISANYHAGITVNQKASWLGLGWDYNPGEITRQVVNTPDDYNGVSVNQYYGSNNASLQYQKVTAMFGSLYNNEINRNPYPTDPLQASYYKSGDNKGMVYNLSEAERCAMISGVGPIGSAVNCNDPNFTPSANASYRFNRHTVPYTGLAYDQYNVSGEGIGGSIHPYYLGNVQIHPEVNALAVGLPVASKKCQFYFENSSFQNVNSTNNASASVVNTITNRIHSGTFVKYFTNDDINNNTNLYSSGNITGYLDYKPVTSLSAVRRPTPDNNPDIIGAFQITNASGMVYHYSLPVYETNDVSTSFDNNGTLQTISSNSCPYATSWKLTAITGPDYIDANGNYTADEGDTGYWITYNYTLWSNNYAWASQRYNAKSDALLSPKIINFALSSAVGNQYVRTNAISFGTTQVYALNYIKTASHTACFVKSVRQDEQSYNNVYNTSVKPESLLKLDKVVILRNKDQNLLLTGSSLSSSDQDSRFNYTTCSTCGLSDPNFINITRYNTNKVAIDKAALTTAELTTNYSLAKKYINNINNSFTTADNIFCPWAIGGHTIAPLPYSFYKTLTGYTGSSNPTNSGKLTLKKITVYNLNGQKVTPSIDFAYNEGSTTKNPDFDVDKTDLWGYYKNDYINSHYVTSTSKADVDAWSLKEINTSLGGKIAVTYESDMYHSEGFNGDLPFYKIFTGNYVTNTIPTNMPHLIFPITAMDLTTGSTTFADGDFAAFNSGSLYLVYNVVDQCTHPLITYNGGNDSYTPDPQKQLVHYGADVAYSGGSGVGPYTAAFAATPSPEFTFNCQTGWMPGSPLASTGVNHVVYFSPYLYGGGIRVNQIAVTDSFSGKTYTQRFEYGNGYCPIVPKSNAFSTDNGPSNHDVIMNTKTLIDARLTGSVGYDFCKQYSLNAQSNTTGTVTQTFFNSLIANPISLYTPAMTQQQLWRNGYAQLYHGGGCLVLSSHDATDQTFYDYTISENLLFSDNNHNLGKIKSVADETSSTVYGYSAMAVSERYLHPTTEDVPYKFFFTYPLSGTGQCAYYYFQTDHYINNFSDVNTFYSFPSYTSTTKDGITITESVNERDRYTGLPTHVKVTDPTKGVFDTYTAYIYTTTVTGSSTLAYPTLNLQSKNETNRNILSPVTSKKVIKDNTYVISESKATYSNSYSIRSRINPTGPYGSIIFPPKPWYHLNETYERLLDDDVLSTTAPVSADYRKLSSNLLYDTDYNCIEQEGLNGRRTASKWGYNNLYKLASITNANYTSFTFSGFEDQATVPGGGGDIHYGGEVTHGETRMQATIDPALGTLITPHTGSSFAGVAQNGAGPRFLSTNFNTGRTYIAKVWVHISSPATAALNIQLTGTAGSSPLAVTKTINKSNTSNVRVNDWILMSTEIDVPANFNLSAAHTMYVYVSNTGGAGQAYFDDLSFHPKDAVMTGNVYNEQNGLLVAQLDNDNFATLYNYDNALRLISTYKEYSGGVKKISETGYQYAKP